MKAYWVLNKQTLDGASCGSITAVVNFTGIKRYKLDRVFSEKKEETYESELWKINKGVLVRSKRKQSPG